MVPRNSMLRPLLPLLYLVHLRYPQDAPASAVDWLESVDAYPQDRRYITASTATVYSKHFGTKAKLVG